MTRAGFLVLLVIALYAQSAEASSVLTVKWRAPCQVEESDSYFSIDVFADGTVRYVGGAQAKEVGERVKQVNEADLKRLLREARQFVSSRPTPAKRAETATSVDLSYCLDVTL